MIIKPNPKAQKVIFFLTSYRAPWFIYKPAIEKLRRSGYEVVVYDFKNAIVDNEDPAILPAFVETLCTDIHDRIAKYEMQGIKIFDGVGNSLGSFLLHNYIVRYPLRRVVLNTVSYMSQVVANTKHKHISKTREVYTAKGFDLRKLEEAWKSIDSPESGINNKAQKTLIFTVINDQYVTRASAESVIAHTKQSNTELTVYTNTKLSHNIGVVRNAHSKILLKFLLEE